LIKKLIEDVKAHREGILAQGFWALTVYRFGNARYRYQSKLIRKPWGLIHLLLSKLIEITCGICIHDCAVIGRKVQIEHFGDIIIHGNAVIGDNCLIRQGVTIGNKNIEEPLAAPILGQGVVIGAGAKLLGKIKIGDHAVIGANAVVITDVPSGALAVGVPALVKKAEGQ